MQQPKPQPPLPCHNTRVVVPPPQSQSQLLPLAQPVGEQPSDDVVDVVVEPVAATGDAAAAAAGPDVVRDVVFGRVPAEQIRGILDYNNPIHYDMYMQGTKPLCGGKDDEDEEFDVWYQPLNLHQDAILDFNDWNDYNIYKRGIKPLWVETFDGQRSKLNRFLEAFAKKETFMAWQPLFTIVINGMPQHLPIMIGVTESWRQHITAVETASTGMALVHQTQTRACQDSCMSGQCLWASLTMEARNKVTTFAHLYKFDGYTSGPVLLQAIIASTSPY